MSILKFKEGNKREKESFDINKYYKHEPIAKILLKEKIPCLISENLNSLSN